MTVRRFHAAAALLAIGFLPGPALAALAPNYQRAAELNAVVSAVAALLPQNPIDSVEYVGTDEYSVRAGDCSLTVEIVDKPAGTGLVGPRQFEARPGKPDCGK